MASSSPATSSPQRELRSSQDVEDDVSVIPESSQESNASEAAAAVPVTSSTPHKQDKTAASSTANLPASAHKGGAVSGLLSLARGEA